MESKVSLVELSKVYTRANKVRQEQNSEAENREIGPKHVQLGNWELANWILGPGGSLWAIRAAMALLAIGYAGGSLAEAVESTARRSEALFGVRVGGGVYVNYVFVAVWWLDAIWRWQAPPTRFRPMEFAVDSFLILMSFFGAVVFASGPIRYVGILAIAVWIWVDGKRRG